ncbi:hypothetical protein AHMF7605_13165 [Adhaeribacter arboris]|uniref:Type IX secretion system membrane protein PorP/SprF n=1 Tax=Adhaeribacter arboris TaxID=2072846 RepID=A0A2T2YFX2_9BACT|nr:type IX secretion system membrane protein PorP/SprF [Adhaeribacter arboris]PSR54392.1 hypothetical protein AHMF7605_13165 [Adhaeribacter arboris]
MKLRLFFAAMLLSFSSMAQYKPQYTQYIFNGLVINPAYAGSKNVVHLNAFYRTQWTGLEGAPTTQSFSIDGVNKSNRIGVGVQAINDQIGAQRRTSASINGAVKLNVSESGVLSVGIAAGASQFRVDRNKLITTDPNDHTIDNAETNLIQPDLKLGVYFHTDKFYLGISATDLLDMKQENAFNPERSYFLTTGYVFDLGEHLKFKPSILMKENFHGPTNLDLNAFLLIENRIWLGGTYRTAANIFKNNFEASDLANKDAVSAIAEVFLSPKLRLGYSYDFTLTQLNNYSTHEFSLGVLLFKKAETKMLTPQYF